MLQTKPREQHGEQVKDGDDEAVVPGQTIPQIHTVPENGSAWTTQ